MLSEIIKQGYGKEEGYNCAQKILHGANKVYELGLDDKALSLCVGFGGGIAIGSVCGALTGGVMVLSILYKSKYEKEEFRSIIKNYFNEYHKRMGSINCDELKGSEHYNDVVKCDVIIHEAAIALEDIIERLGF